MHEDLNVPAELAAPSVEGLGGLAVQGYQSAEGLTAETSATQEAAGSSSSGTPDANSQYYW